MNNYAGIATNAGIRYNGDMNGAIEMSTQTDYWCVACSEPMIHDETNCRVCGFPHDRCTRCGVVFWEEFCGPELCPECTELRQNEEEPA